jgi:hypothetical protein
MRQIKRRTSLNLQPGMLPEDEFIKQIDNVCRETMHYEEGPKQTIEKLETSL